MTPACPFCGSETELSHNGSEHRHTGKKIFPTAHFRICRGLGCRAQGPHRPSPEGANLAFLHRASRLRVAVAQPPAHPALG